MTEVHELTARKLRDAYAGGAVPPLRDVLKPTDEAGAYAVQNINTRFWVSEGRRIVGRKIGLTAEAVQKQLGVDRPDFGVLFEDMQLEDGGILPVSRTLQPKADPLPSTLHCPTNDPPRGQCRWHPRCASGHSGRMCRRGGC